MNGNQVASAIATEATSASIVASNGNTVEVTLEDILGRTSTQTTTIGGGAPTLSVVYFDSQETSGENGAAINAIDGSTSSIWHTQWSAANPPYPHEIQLSLGGSFSATGFTYLPRQDGSQNGRIAQYEVYVSTSTSNWGNPVATGTWANTSALKTVTFAAKTGSYVRLKALSEVNGNAWASAAELNVTTGQSGARFANREKKIIETNNFLMYPNPTKGIVNISIQSKMIENVDLRLLDVGGKIYLSKNYQLAIGNNEIQLDIHNLKAGLYTLQIKGLHTNYTSRVLLGD